MKTTSRVSEKGQVTIPKAVRDRLGIRPGVILEFETNKGRLIARKVMEVDPVAAVYGILKLPGTTDELIEEMRGPVDQVD